MKSTFALSLVLLITLSATIPSSLPGQASNSKDTDWPGHISLINQTLPDFFGPQSLPMRPVPIERAIAEWETTRAVLVSMPLAATLSNPPFFDYYLALIKAAVSYVDVGILHGVSDAKTVDRFIKRLEDEGFTGDELANIHFIESQASDFWIRDYGPVFGLGPGGGLVVFDNMYRPLEPELETWNQAPMSIDSPSLTQDHKGFENYKNEKRRLETSPLYISKFIRQTYNYSSVLVRPPLHLQGGDYITDGNGRFYISEDTILANADDRETVEKVFRDYYGADELFVLKSFPGIAAKHLDLLMKLVDENTIIFAAPPVTTNGTSRHNRRLYAEIAAIQKSNEAYLRKYHPNCKILHAPILPLLSEDFDTILNKIRAQIFAYVCDELGISYLTYHQLSRNHPDRLEIKKIVADYLDKQFQKPIDLIKHADLDLVTRTYMNADLNTLMDTNTDLKTIFRSYLNSLFIKNKEGETAWLLPRYRARNGESAEDIESHEKTVEKLYRSLNPEAKIHWLDSDVMAETLGAIHCTTISIPHVNSENSAAKKLRITN
ncbi:MAG: agmatine deiminase family protein [Verrucomicrobia bacterium]|nr:agmatine deiminase family protein [Verrucomicrobiota bacterium]